MQRHKIKVPNNLQCIYILLVERAYVAHTSYPTQVHNGLVTAAMGAIMRRNGRTVAALTGAQAGHPRAIMEPNVAMTWTWNIQGS